MSPVCEAIGKDRKRSYLAIESKGGWGGGSMGVEDENEVERGS